MSEFKAGDKVICIGMDENYCDKLAIGEVYTVRHTYRHNGNSWINIIGRLGYQTKYFIPFTLEHQYPFETIDSFRNV